MVITKQDIIVAQAAEIYQLRLKLMKLLEGIKTLNSDFSGLTNHWKGIPEKYNNDCDIHNSDLAIGWIKNAINELQDALKE